jgi:hypothetical protein
MSGYLFVHICMHVTYTNKILVNERVTTFPMHARECIIDTSKKQVKTHQCMEHAHVREKRYSKRKNKMVFLWLLTHPAASMMILVSYCFCTLIGKPPLWLTRYRRNRSNFDFFGRLVMLILRDQWG